MEFVHGFGMHEPLEGQVGAKQSQYQLWREPNEYGRKVEHPGADDAVQNALARRGRHIHVFAGVVGDVLAPEPTHSVCGAVKPVIAKLLHKKRQNDCS